MLNLFLTLNVLSCNPSSKGFFVYFQLLVKIFNFWWKFSTKNWKPDQTYQITPCKNKNNTNIIYKKRLMPKGPGLKSSGLHISVKYVTYGPKGRRIESRLRWQGFNPMSNPIQFKQRNTSEMGHWKMPHLKRQNDTSVCYLFVLWTKLLTAHL